MTEQSSVPYLKLSSKMVGKLYPVLLDSDGNVIDGKHRLEADAYWPTVRLNHISSEKERLLARLISNVCRRTVRAEEKRKMLESLGKLYVEEGEKPGRLAYRIAEDVGMTYRWVMKYLPDYMKARPGLGGPHGIEEFDNCDGKADARGVERRSTQTLARLLADNTQKVVIVRTYVNADFVSLTMEKKFYQTFERLADKLGVSPPTLINNAIIVTLKEIENLLKTEG